jgi:glycosyltransferase involved in cell wall biosynthesis
MALLATALPPEHERLVCSIDDGPFAEVLRQEGVGVVALGRGRRLDLSPLVHLGRVIFSYRPDVVHCYGWMGAMASALPCRSLAIPLIDGSIRSGSVLKHRAHMYWLTARVADEVIANSRSGLLAHPVPPRKGTVIQNGFDARRIPTRSALSATIEGGLRVVMAARMNPEKDYRTFIDAARLWAENDLQASKAVFLPVGDGSDRDRLMRSSWDVVEQGYLEFPPPGLDVMGTIAASDVGVLLTDPRLAVEGCSNSILEYMACGLPVVCSRGGGNAEVVVEGQTGFIIPPSDAPSLVERLRYLESHPAEARRMGSEGRSRVMRLFSADRLAEDALRLYRQVITRRRRPGPRVTAYEERNA